MHEWFQVIGPNVAVRVQAVIREALERVSRDEAVAGDLQEGEFVNPNLRSALLAVGSSSDESGISSKRLGRWLKSQEGRIVNGQSFVRSGVSNGYQLWMLKETPM